MPRVKRGVTAHQRRKKVLAITKGQRGGRHKLYRTAHEAMIHSLAYSYAHRRERKAQFRSLWIARINAAARSLGLSYSCLVQGLKQAGLALNRKMLADLALREPEAFSRIASIAKENLKAPS